MPTRFIKQFLLIAFVLTGFISPLSGCQPAPDNKVAATGTENTSPHLLSAEFIDEITAEEIGKRFEKLPQVGLLTRYAVKVYRLEYRTTGPNGTETKASGAILVPVTEQPLPLLSHQHGT
ncbi:MAG: hypothetical protein EOP51_29935, partial [Sphingobacteriales bacterium]